MGIINFYKYQGTGNDFILIDQREQEFDLTVDQIERLCNRHKGIGADGLILIRRHHKADFAMHYYNSDGNESTMCGNGGRCALAFYQDLTGSTSQVKFYAIDGIHVGSKKDDLVSLSLKDVDLITVDGEALLIDTGSPHYITFEQDLDQIDVHQEGARIRNMPTYEKEGINVNFVDLQPDYIAMRTYERGVEGETLSCGTGVTAAAIAAHNQRREEYQSPVTVHTLGGTLKVEFDYDGKSYSNIFLKGPAKLVFEGNITF